MPANRIRRNEIQRRPRGAFFMYRDFGSPAVSHACNASLFRVPESAARARAGRGTPGSPRDHTFSREPATCDGGSTWLGSQNLLALSLIEIGTLQRSAFARMSACGLRTPWPTAIRQRRGREKSPSRSRAVRVPGEMSPEHVQIARRRRVSQFRCLEPQIRRQACARSAAVRDDAVPRLWRLPESVCPCGRAARLCA